MTEVRSGIAPERIRGNPNPRQTMAGMQKHAANGEMTTAQDVAQAIFRVATDPDCPMILPAGADVIAMVRMSLND